MALVTGGSSGIGVNLLFPAVCTGASAQRVARGARNDHRQSQAARRRALAHSCTTYRLRITRDRPPWVAKEHATFQRSHKSDG